MSDVALGNTLSGRSQPGNKNPMYGKHHSPESIQKMRENRKGLTAGENHPMFGKHLPVKTRQKMSVAKKLNPNPENLGPVRRGKDHPMFGRKHTPESILKMKEHGKGKGKGIPKSDLHCQHISEGRVGIKRPEMSGDKHYNWRGGISFEPYCPKFNKEFKERVRAFFGHTCQLCGHVWQKSEPKLAVHHVNYRKDACCSPEVQPLFVPVCFGSCHAKTNNHRQEYEQQFTDLIMTKFGGQCYLPKGES